MRVEISSQGKKYLERLNSPMNNRIIKALVKLSQDPPQGDIKVMQGNNNLYRLRVGDFRLIFSIESIVNEDNEQETIILINKIAPRGEIYK